MERLHAYKYYINVIWMSICIAKDIHYLGTSLVLALQTFMLSLRTEYLQYREGGLGKMRDILLSFHS